MEKYIYFDISLKCSEDISAHFFKHHIIQCMQSLFGEVGAGTPIDILKYDANSQRAIIRCPSNSYVHLRASLMLSGKFQTVDCAFMVHKVSHFLCSLLGDSRSYIHSF